MTKLARSPDRHSFQKQSYLKRRADDGRTPDNDREVAAMIEYHDNIVRECDQREKDPEWAKNNLEYDLRSTEWIVEKVRQDVNYAQNLYAALCNNSFQRLDAWLILTDKHWSCSWRYAGGIVANMRGEGDYIDWYCSGILEDDEQSAADCKYVAESVVTEEICQDLLTLGWRVLTE